MLLLLLLLIVLADLLVGDNLLPALYYLYRTYHLTKVTSTSITKLSSTTIRNCFKATVFAGCSLFVVFCLLVRWLIVLFCPC